MTHVGYIVVDCTGINLNTSSEQTIAGIYNKCIAALDTGKPVFAANCNMSGAPCSPVSVAAWKEGTTIIATGHVFRMTITSADKVTVTNLVAG